MKDTKTYHVGVTRQDEIGSVEMMNAQFMKAVPRLPGFSIIKIAISMLKCPAAIFIHGATSTIGGSPTPQAVLLGIFRVKHNAYVWYHFVAKNESKC